MVTKQADNFWDYNHQEIPEGEAENFMHEDSSPADDVLYAADVLYDDDAELPTDTPEAGMDMLAVDEGEDPEGGTIEIEEEDVGDLFDQDLDTEEVVLELEEGDGEIQEFVFSLPKFPGADDDSDIEEPVIEIVEHAEEAPTDMWNWQSGGLGNFLGWLHGMITNVPRHSGKDTTGLEKAISYFENIDREITKAMRQDYRDEIDSAKAEEARAQIEDGLERLVERLDKVKTTKYKRHSKKSKKKGAANPELVKEAGTTNISGITITVPLFISHLARICINGSVSAGHDIEDMYAKLATRYELTPREKAEFIQLLADMNYPLRLDRGFIGDEDNYDPKKSGFDFPANFPD